MLSWVCAALVYAGSNGAWADDAPVSAGSATSSVSEATATSEIHFVGVRRFRNRRFWRRGSDWFPGGAWSQAAPAPAGENRAGSPPAPGPSESGAATTETPRTEDSTPPEARERGLQDANVETGLNDFNSMSSSFGAASSPQSSAPYLLGDAFGGGGGTSQLPTFVVGTPLLVNTTIQPVDQAVSHVS